MEVPEFSKLSHALRTPMSAILSSAEILEYYSDALNEQKKNELLGRIKTAVQEMLSVLETPR